jgi:3-hydroxyacyl-[acyl-carrier-protein] dehydratase
MLEHAAVRDVIPHRHPVLLVDRVLEIEPFERIVTTKTISGSEPCYAGMAEGLPQSAFAYPVSLIIESFGQSGAVLWIQSVKQSAEPLTGALMFAAARNVTISGEAYPGDTLRHEAFVEQIVGDNAFLRGATYVGDRLIATVGSAIAVLRPAPAHEPEPALAAG